MRFLRRRPVSIVAIVVTIAALVGMSIERRIDFLARPVQLPDPVPGVWLTFNWLLTLIAIVVIYRNVWRLESRLTWQEMGFARGTLLMVIAGSLGIFARAFDDPTVSLGTPIFTGAVLTLIGSSLQPPERFEEG